MNDYFSSLGINDKQSELLDQETTKKLIKQAQKGDINAMNELCLHNSRLVLKQATQYLTNNLEIEDLMQAGFIGLMRAVEKFDLSTDNQFSTYAVIWIRQTILRTIQNESNLIRVPTNVFQSMWIVLKAIDDYKKENKDENEPTNKEILDWINIHEDKYKLDKSQKNINYIKQMREYNTINNKVYLDNPTQDTTDSSVIGDFIPSNKPSPEEEIVSKEMSNYIVSILDKIDISERDKNIFIDYHINRLTLQQIGKNYGGLSRERIRNICKNVVKKLRVNKDIREIRRLYKNREPIKTNKTIDIINEEDYAGIPGILTEEEYNKRNKAGTKKG